MLKTIDGGQTWQRQTLRGDSTIEHQQVVFADAQHGWLITREPIVNGRSYWQYRTTNGGRTWQPMVGIENIDFIAAASAQRVATHFAYSTNGGLTWQTNTTRPIYSGRFVLRPSGAGFHVIGPQRTTDFGATWTGRTAAFEGDISPVTPFDARRAWVGAAGGAGVSAARTLDRGAHWEVSKLHEIATDSLGWVLSGPGGAWAFPDLDTAYMATAHGTPAAPFPYHSDIMRTADGGRTWQPQLLPPGTPPLWALAFYNSRHGCGVGDSGAIVLTHDGGQTWQRIANDSTRRLVAVSWASPTLLLAIAIANDNAIRPSDLMRSTDGGRTWTHQANIYAQYGPISWRTPTEPWLPGYLNQTQVVAGRSTDGGLTWQPFIPVPTPAISTNELLRGFYGVTFSDSLHGWYRDRRPIYTADGGLTWRAMSDSYALPALSQYVDRYNGWLFGGYTTIPGGLLHYSEKYIQADTSLARRTYCAGDTLLLRYTRTGTFGATEQAMVAEISNAQGRFGQYPPVVGQGTASPLRVVLPATLAPGTGYLVRVARADHSVIGGDNQQPLAIYRRPAATVSPAGPLVVCAGDSLRLTAPAGFGQYKWSTGDTTATLYVAQAGTYAVQVATGGGCFGAASPPVVVSVTPRPASPVIAVQQGAAGALAVLSTSTVAAGYQWLLNGVPVGTGATYAVSTAAQSGSYTLVVTQNGCASGPSGPQTVVVLGAIGDVTTGALSVYPNPTKDQVIVRSVGAAVADVTLTDQAGRVVARTAGAAAPETVLLLAGVPAGSYLLRVRFRDGRQTTRSLLVQP